MRFRLISLGMILLLFSCQSLVDSDKMNAFFAMDTGTGSGSPAEKAQMLKELGFNGTDFSALSSFGRSLDQLPAYVEALDAHELKLFAVYITISIDGDLDCPSDLKKAMAILNGRELLDGQIKDIKERILSNRSKNPVSL